MVPKPRHEQQSLLDDNNNKKGDNDFKDHLSQTGNVGAISYGSASTSNDDNSQRSSSSVGVTLTMDEAIERLGYGRFQHYLLCAAGLCVMADGFEVLLLSFLTLVLQSSDSQWNLSSTQTSSITSFVFMGAFVGTLVLGRLADTMGRKPVFTVTSAMIAIFGLASGIAPTYNALLLCRFAVGIGLGGIVVPFDTLTEFLPSSHRGHNLLLIDFFWTSGTMSVVVLAYFTLGQGTRTQDGIDVNGNGSDSAAHDEFAEFWESWRIFVILCAIPCIFSTLWGLWFVPESPRWLVTTKNDPDRALKVLRDAAVVNGKDPNELFPPNTKLLREGKQEASPSQSFVHEEGGLRELFSPRWLRTTVFLWGTWLGFAFLYYGGVIVTTMVFANSGKTIHTGHAGNGRSSYHFDYGALFIANSAEIVGTAVVVMTVDTIGRIPTQSFAYFTGGALVCILCFLASHSDHGQYRISMVVLAFGTRMLMMCASCVTWVSTAEILTTDIRATGHSYANAVARVGGFVCPYIVAPSTSLTTIGSCMFVVACFTAFCVSHLPETKGLDLGAATLETHGRVKSSRDDEKPLHHHDTII